MSELIIIAATDAHAEELALDLRPEDAAEVLAAGHPSARAALLRSLECSELAWAGMVDGKVAAMFGLSPAVDGSATVWFLTGRHFVAHARLFVARAKAVVRRLIAPYVRLENYVDARYDAALRWVRWLGFELSEAKPYGPNGQLFHLATLRRV